MGEMQYCIKGGKRVDTKISKKEFKAFTKDMVLEH